MVWYQSILVIYFMDTSLYYSYVIMSVSNHRRPDCLLYHLFRRRSKKTPKLRITGLCERNSPVNDGFPSQSTSNVEYISIWWYHHGQRGDVSISLKQPRKIWVNAAHIFSFNWLYNHGKINKTVCITSMVIMALLLEDKIIVSRAAKYSWWPIRNYTMTRMRILLPWWRDQMETFSALLAICAGNSPVHRYHKGQWRGALMFSLNCVWINGWVNNGEAGDLRRHHAHYEVIVMSMHNCFEVPIALHFRIILSVHMTESTQTDGINRNLIRVKSEKIWCIRDMKYSDAVAWCAMSDTYFTDLNSTILVYPGLSGSVFVTLWVHGNVHFRRNGRLYEFISKIFRHSIW